jgi:hypothetical protein
MPTNINYLLPLVRLKVGDLEPTTYRYMDSWLETALVASVRALWSIKYSITDLGEITRQPLYTNFWDDETVVGVVEPRDEYPISILAAIITLQGSLQNNSWNLASWKDAEISFTNLESGRLQDANLARLFEELYSYTKPPTKRLARAYGYPLQGYHNNRYENKTKL